MSFLPAEASAPKEQGQLSSLLVPLQILVDKHLHDI